VGRSCAPAPLSHKRIPESRLGSFANPGNGLYRDELRRAVAAIGRYSKAHDAARGASRAAVGWAIWHGSRPCRVGGPLLCDALAVTTPCSIAQRCRAACTCRPISSSAARKVSWYAPSTIARMCRWGQRDNGAAWWWRLIRPPLRRAASASPARAWSTNSSLLCPRALSPRPMSSPSICIVGLTPPPWPMKTRNKTPTAGVLTLLLGSPPGKSSRNGSGTHRPGTGASIGADPHAHHRVCSRQGRGV